MIAIAHRVPEIPAASIATGATIVSGAAYDGIDADMVDMESFAVLRAARPFGVPMIGLRGISDGRRDLTGLHDWTEYPARHRREARRPPFRHSLPRRCGGPVRGRADRQSAKATGMTDTVLIIDFGSQVTQLIARRVREAGVYSEIVAVQHRPRRRCARLKPKAIILSGGPASVLDKDAPLPPPSVYTAGVPILGICYGEQAMAHQLGGKVEGEHNREFGRAFVEITRPSALFDGVWRKGERHQVWMSHGDRVTALPPGLLGRRGHPRARPSR